MALTQPGLRHKIMNEYTTWLQEQIVALDYELDQPSAQRLPNEVFQAKIIKLQKYSDAWDVLIEFDRRHSYTRLCTPLPV